MEDQINNQPFPTESCVPGTALTPLHKFSLENISNGRHMGYQKQAHLLQSHPSHSAKAGDQTAMSSLLHLIED